MDQGGYILLGGGLKVVDGEGGGGGLENSKYKSTVPLYIKKSKNLIRKIFSLNYLLLLI